MFRKPSVQTLALRGLARQPLHVAFDSRGFLSLSFLGRFFIELPPTQFGKNAGFLTSALETTQGCVEMLALPDFDAGHEQNTFECGESNNQPGHKKISRAGKTA